MKEHTHIHKRSGWAYSQFLDHNAAARMANFLTEAVNDPRANQEEIARVEARCKHLSQMVGDISKTYGDASTRFVKIALSNFVEKTLSEEKVRTSHDIDHAAAAFNKASIYTVIGTAAHAAKPEKGTMQHTAKSIFTKESKRTRDAVLQSVKEYQCNWEHGDAEHPIQPLDSIGKRIKAQKQLFADSPGRE